MEAKEIGKQVPESPDFLKMSTATSMELGFIRGRFYRGARNPCVNLLLTYREGCYANCAYCGLARKRPGKYADKSFIKVEWPTAPSGEIVRRVRERESRLRRICFSMITNPRAVEDTRRLVAMFRESSSLPISVLCAPTLLRRDHLEAYREAGADMLGVAVDAAHIDLFRRHRGKGVNGPHRWDRYWETVRTGVSIFGKRKVSVHLIAGIGETDRELVEAFQRVHDEHALIHLFSFFPEPGSGLDDLPQPPWDRYLRLQVTRGLIEEGACRAEDFRFDAGGALVRFGRNDSYVRKRVEEGTLFLTSGCPGADGSLACNRPFGNCLPGPRQWNYPYLPNEEEMELIRKALFSGDASRRESPSLPETQGVRTPQDPEEWAGPEAVGLP